MRRPKVLIIEDEAPLRAAYTRILAHEDYQILEAPDGASGLALARAESPDLVLLDAILPDGSGVEFCKKLKAETGAGDAFVVMISGLRTTAEHQAEALEAGADGFLAKPLEPVSLRAHARAFLRIRQNEEDLRES